MEPLYLHGCRHDILGHYLKAIGLVRVLAKCAESQHRDADAEGWWDIGKACFCLRSSKYPTHEKLVEFFEQRYPPTPFFSPWNTGGGLNEKKEIAFSISRASWQEFWKYNRDTILPVISNDDSERATGEMRFDDKPLKLTLSAAIPELKGHPDITVRAGLSQGKKPKPFVEFSWSKEALNEFFQALDAHRPVLERIIKFTGAVKKISSYFSNFRDRQYQEEWRTLLAELEHEPEFRIARAVASIVGRMRQRNGRDSEVLPMLGSLLPLKLGPGGWYLPTKGERSCQAVWTRTDPCHDLAAVLSRRYLNSLNEQQRALISSFGASLGDVLSFLRGELDDHRIARWSEALSLIGWKLAKVEDGPKESDNESHAIPPEYAALRTPIELEWGPRKEGETKKRHSQQPIALLCQH